MRTCLLHSLPTAAAFCLFVVAGAQSVLAVDAPRAKSAPAPPAAKAADNPPATSNSPAKPAAKTAVHKRALLVGCTTYDHLPQARHLAGPANDVALMQKLLEQRFGFDEFHVLTEDAGPGNRPTAANIAREFDKLIELTEPGDQIFILMAGHGSQQPVDPNDHDPDNFEPDGLDEIFLPADVTPSNDASPVANSITDNQVRGWLAGLRAKGATIAIVVDACHSGGMVRGNEEETTREVPADELSSSAAIEAAEQQAKAQAATQTVAEAKATFKIPPDAPQLVAIYAAQATEPTVERKLPARATDPKSYGLLTFTINKVLLGSRRPLTYTELIQRVHAEYAADGRSFPTPLVEGQDKDNFVFSDTTAPERPKILLSRDDDQNWHVDAGQLVGLTPGSVLAVFPLAGADNDDQPIGYVKVIAAGLGAVSAMVDPCAYAELPAPAELVPNMRCRVEYVDLETPPLRIAVDTRPESGAESGDAKPQFLDSEAGLLRSELHKLDGESEQFVIVDDPSDADWLVCKVDRRPDDLFLMPRSGILRSKQTDDGPPTQFGPIPRDGLNRWLAERLARIARVQTLLRIVGSSDSLPDGGDSSLDVQLLKLKDKNHPGEPLGELVLKSGDRVGLRIKNQDRDPVDVTVLFIDSGFGISTFFPRAAGIENRLKASDPPLELRAKITASTVGMEHVLIIGTRPKPNTDPTDFSFLSQPTIERARSSSECGGALDSALGKLFQHAVFQTGSTRGLAGDEVQGTFLKLYSWRVEP
jgi:Caspase domain